VEGTEEWNQLEGEIQELKGRQKTNFRGRKHLGEYREVLLLMDSTLPNIL
jgi:hypothetical protein